MSKQNPTRLRALLYQYDLYMGKPLAELLEIDIKTAYRRLEDTDRLTVRELKLLHRRGGIPAAEIAAAVFWDGDTPGKSERPAAATAGRSMSKPDGIVAGQRPLTQSVYCARAQMSRQIPPGKAVKGK